MELLDFEQIDTGLAKVAAMQKLPMMISIRTSQHVTDIKMNNGHWQCFVPEIGWQPTSEVLSGRQEQYC